MIPNGILGGEGDDIAEEFVRHVSLDRERDVWVYSERIAIPNRPFMGIFAVAPAGSGRTRTRLPGPVRGQRRLQGVHRGLDRLSPRLPPGRAVLDG